MQYTWCTNYKVTCAHIVLYKHVYIYYAFLLLTDSTRFDSWSNGMCDTSPNISNVFILSFLMGSGYLLMKYTALFLEDEGKVTSGVSWPFEARYTTRIRLSAFSKNSEIITKFSSWLIIYRRIESIN